MNLSPSLFASARCPYVSDDASLRTTGEQRDDNWPCGQTAGHLGRHILYSPHGETTVFTNGRWILPEELKPAPVDDTEVVKPSREALDAAIDSAVEEAHQVVYKALLAKAFWSDDSEADVVEMSAIESILGVGPPMEEPGIWGVISAECRCEAGVVRTWIRQASDDRWLSIPSSLDDLHLHDWDSIFNPRLIRDGVASN